MARLPGCVRGIRSLGSRLARKLWPAPKGCSIGANWRCCPGKAARVLEPFIEVLEAGNGVGDQVADAPVIRRQPVPVQRMVAQGRGSGIPRSRARSAFALTVAATVEVKQSPCQRDQGEPGQTPRSHRCAISPQRSRSISLSRVALGISSAAAKLFANCFPCAYLLCCAPRQSSTPRV